MRVTHETFAKSDHLESLIGQNNLGIVPTLAGHPDLSSPVASKTSVARSVFNRGSSPMRVREGRIGRNPKTGATVQVPERKFPYFRQGQKFGKRLNSVAEASEGISSAQRTST